MGLATNVNDEGLIASAFATGGESFGPDKLVTWVGKRPVGMLVYCTKKNASSWVDESGNSFFGGIAVTEMEPVQNVADRVETMADQFRTVYIGTLEAVLFKMPENAPIDTNFVLSASRAALDAWDAFASTMEEMEELRSQLRGHEDRGNLDLSAVTPTGEPKPRRATEEEMRDAHGPS